MLRQEAAHLIGPAGRRPGQAWGDHVGANPVDRGKPGSKLHLVCDGSGVPLTAVVTAASRSGERHGTGPVSTMRVGIPAMIRPARASRPGASSSVSQSIHSAALQPAARSAARRSASAQLASRKSVSGR